MNLDNEKFVGEGLTYDDVLLVPSYSNVLPRETSLKTKFSRNIDLNIPVAPRCSRLSLDLSQYRIQ